MDTISKHFVEELRDGQDKSLDTNGNEGILINGRLLKPDDRVYDLVEVIKDGKISEGQQNREIDVINGQVSHKICSPNDKAVELTDVVEKAYHEEVIKRISETAERIAREMIPGIAERIIREEIEKIKG